MAGFHVVGWGGEAPPPIEGEIEERERERESYLDTVFCYM